MYYVHITHKFHKMERRNKRKLDISKKNDVQEIISPRNQRCKQIIPK